jgi:hypothetical protein
LGMRLCPMSVTDEMASVMVRAMAGAGSTRS